MPELPDVELLRRYVNATALRQKIHEVEVWSPEMLERVSAWVFRARLKSNQFEATRRHGKHLFISLQSGQWVTLHFGMTGGLVYFKNQGNMPDYTRFLITFTDGFHLAYDSLRKLGKVGLIETPSAYVGWKGLGRDALDPGLSVGELKRLFAGKRASIKSALMDQHVIAGIGNLYGDEILFQAGIHPETDAGSLGEKALKSLLWIMRRVLETAIERKADPSRFPVSWLLPFRFLNEPCPTCGVRLMRIKLAGRTSYFCGNCQPRKASNTTRLIRKNISGCCV